jgi:hypothetical protein
VYCVLCFELHPDRPACVSFSCCHTIRGLAHIAGFILIVMGPASEEAAFWVLLALLEDKMYGYCNAQVRGCGCARCSKWFLLCTYSPDPAGIFKGWCRRPWCHC